MVAEWQGSLTRSPKVIGMTFLFRNDIRCAPNLEGTIDRPWSHPTVAVQEAIV